MTQFLPLRPPDELPPELPPENPPPLLNPLLRLPPELKPDPLLRHPELSLPEFPIPDREEFHGEVAGEEL